MASVRKDMRKPVIHSTGTQFCAASQGTGGLGLEPAGEVAEGVGILDPAFEAVAQAGPAGLLGVFGGHGIAVAEVGARGGRSAGVAQTPAMRASVSRS